MSAFSDTESPCRDCGKPTTPGSGAGEWEWYVLREEVWAEAGMPVGAIRYSGRGYLCLACLTRRLGRPLTWRDLAPDVPLNLYPTGLETRELLELKHGLLHHVLANTR